MAFFYRRCLRAGLSLRRLIFVPLLVFPSTVESAVDFSLVLVVSTRSQQGNVPVLVFLYGDPELYIAEFKRTQSYTISGTDTYQTYFLPKTSPISSLSNGPVDVDYRRGALWWSDELQQTITSVPWFLPTTSNGTMYESSVASLSNQVTGLSVDWVSNLLYWSDAAYQRIGVIDTVNMKYWRIVVDTNLSSPQDVVAYPPLSYLFWSEAGSTPKIEMLDLIQNNRTVLVTSPTVQSPKTLVIDYASLRLYWLDTAKAELSSVKLDGSDYIPWQSSLFSQISSFVFYKLFLILSDQSYYACYAFNASQSYFNFTFNTLLLGISDLSMYDPARQPDVTSPCTLNNGGCQEFCITINSTSRKCQCTFGWFLSDDGASCVPDPLRDNFFLVTDSGQKRIYQVDASTGELRGLLINQYLSKSPIAFDKDSNIIYWAANPLGVIQQTDLTTCYSTTCNTTMYATISNSGLAINSIAYDPINNTLYYVDSAQKSIRQIQKPQPNQTTITNFYSENGTQPSVILLDAPSRLMLWSDCAKLSIEIAQLSDPMNHKSVVSSLFNCAVTFAIDFQSRDIFWCDGTGTIQTSKLDGSQKSQFYSDNTFSITRLAVDTSYVYIAASNKKYLPKISRSNRQILNFTKTLFSQPYALLAYSSLGTYGDITPTTQLPPIIDPTTKIIIIACAAGGSVVLIIIVVVIVVVAVKKCRRNSTKNPDNVSEYDDIDENQVTDIDDQAPGQYERMPDGYECVKDVGENLPDDYNYLHVKSEGENLPNDYLHVIGEGEAPQNDYLHVIGEGELQPNDYLHSRDQPLKDQRQSEQNDYLHVIRQRESLQNDYLDFPGQRDSLPNDNLTVKPDPDVGLYSNSIPSEQVFEDVEKETESPPALVSRTESNDYI